MPTRKVAPAYLSVRGTRSEGEGGGESERAEQASRGAGAQCQEDVLLRAERCEHQIRRKFAVSFKNPQFEITIWSVLE